MIGGDEVLFGKVGGALWGTVKGTWKACNAPEGEKLSAFKEGFDEGYEEGKTVGIIVAK